jgi:sulfatase maturation enzyme AslB (radical SAM superfamily)
MKYLSDFNLISKENIPENKEISKLLYDFYLGVRVLGVQSILEKNELSTVSMVMHNDCNLRCKYCYEMNFLDNEKKYLNIDFAINFIKKFNNLKKICLVGGETFINKKYYKELLSKIEFIDTLYVSTN